MSNYPAYLHRYRGDVDPCLVHSLAEAQAAQAAGYLPWEQAPSHAEWLASASINVRWEHESGASVLLPEGITPAGLWAAGAVTLSLTEDQPAPIVEAIAPTEESAPEELPAETLDDLRAQYEAHTGNPPDGRWGEQRLRTEIQALTALGVNDG